MSNYEMNTNANTKSSLTTQQVTQNQPAGQGNENMSFNMMLKKYYVTKDAPPDLEITHTRIGNKDLNIFPGKYHILPEHWKTFQEEYRKEVFDKGKDEYLTEKQLVIGGPMVVDMDFRFDYTVTERQYSKEHVEDLVNMMTDILKNMYQFNSGDHFNIFIFEKDTVNRLSDKQITKDGIHIMIGIKSDLATQQLLRKSMLEYMPEIFGDLPIQNKWEDVLDDGVAKGHANWQMLGSKKPGCEAYKLTQIYGITYDDTDGEFIIKTTPFEKFNVKTNFHKISVRYTENPSFFYTSEFIKTKEDAIARGDVESGGARKTRSNRSETNYNIGNMAENGASTNSTSSTKWTQQLLAVKNADEMDRLFKEFMDEVNSNPLDYDLYEVALYADALPDKYYETGSYLNWIRLGWALRNESDKLFIVWVRVSAKAKNFAYSSIYDLYDRWKNFDLNNSSGNGLRKASIIYWVRMDAKTEYIRIKDEIMKRSINDILNPTNGDIGDEKKYMLKGTGDWDIANILYKNYKDIFVCVSIKNNVWYKLVGHRWVETDSGIELRKILSDKFRKLFRQYVSNIMAQQGNELNENESKRLKMISDKILDICNRLGRTNDKKNIMTEAKELFYDGNFMSKMDNNPYLLCCNNGVVDFKEKIFRKGHPEDYLTKCANIDYNELKPEDEPIMQEIKDFMDKLFPVKELCNYMWEYLASLLIGVNLQQTFHTFIGVGSNGKSALMDLMSKVLGDYMVDAPLSIITDKRQKVGGLSPEIVELKGARCVVMQEPQKGEVVNEGLMKQLTSGTDTIQARAPYCPKPVYFKPQFKLVLCTNALLKVNAQDNGTWRRIRIVDFMSMFCKKPVQNDPNQPYQFMIEENITEKFEKWAPVFLAMLVKIAFNMEGKVNDCNIVLQSSKSYRESQDYIAEFIADRTIRDPAGTITKTELTNEFNMWYRGAYGHGNASIKEVQQYMDKEFGKFSVHKCWRGVKIYYERDEVHLSNDVSENGDSEADDIRLDEL
jgi:P4 family phage/plasmid primase-like protien